MPIIWSSNDHESTSLDYPARFEESLSLNNRYTVEMSCNHLGYSDKLLKMFPKDYRKNHNLFQFTIIREPLEMINSIYHYYKHFADYRCFQNSNNFSDFLINYDSYIADIGVGFPLCKNGVAYDLGYRDDEDEAIFEMINDLDRKMDLVLILEYYWESMVLLKYALDLSTSDVIAFKLNRAVVNENAILKNERPTELQKYQKLVHKNFPADTAIYNFFRKRFLSKIQTFGMDKMKVEVDILKQATRNEYEKCQVFEVIPLGKNGDFLPEQKVPENKIPWHPPNVRISSLLFNFSRSDDPNFYENCLYKTLPELKMGALVKKYQLEEGIVKRRTLSGWFNQLWYT